MLQRFLQKTGKKNGFVFSFPFLLFGCGAGKSIDHLSLSGSHFRVEMEKNFSISVG